MGRAMAERRFRHRVAHVGLARRDAPFPPCPITRIEVGHTHPKKRLLILPR